MLINLLMIILSYLLGGIPFGYLIVRLIEGKDVRQIGSGNIGATNVFRTSKKVAGILTLLLDAGKGYLAVFMTSIVVHDPTRNWEVAAAVAAILGHVFPVFLKFKGGKGVATGCGAYAAISPLAVLTTLLLFVVTASVSKYVSLASILATAAYPAWAYLYGQPRNVILGGIIGACIIIAKHHSNIRRLFKGTENKFAISEKTV